MGQIMQTNKGKTLTSANSILLIQVPRIFDQFIKIEGYAADNAFDLGDGAIGETRMGVDGKQSGGFTPYEVDFNITIEPNSPSRSLFLTWVNTMKRDQETYYCNLSCELPSIKERYSASGFLVGHKESSSAKKLLEPLQYTLKIVVQPVEVI